MGSRFIITSLAPLSLASRGMEAAGWTTRDEPMTIKRSQFRARWKDSSVSRGRHGLAEGDRIGLQDSTASVATGDAHPLEKPGLNLFPGPFFPAGKTGHRNGRAMELDDLLRGASGPLVEVIHVLGDDTVQLPHSFQFYHRLVGCVGLGIFQGFIKLPAHLPVFFPGFFAGDEFLVIKILGIIFVPHPARDCESPEFPIPCSPRRR